MGHNGATMVPQWATMAPQWGHNRATMALQWRHNGATMGHNGATMAPQWGHNGPQWRHNEHLATTGAGKGYPTGFFFFAITVDLNCSIFQKDLTELRLREAARCRPRGNLAPRFPHCATMAPHCATMGEPSAKVPPRSAAVGRGRAPNNLLQGTPGQLCQILLKN